MTAVKLQEKFSASLDESDRGNYAYGMKKITVYRVEHAGTHVGPYRCDGSHPNTELSQRLSDEHSPNWLKGFDSDHPTPQMDGIWEWPDGGLFGFKSMTQLQQWFSGWEDELHGADFHVGVYRSADPDPFVGYGERQLVFDPHDFDLVEQLPLVDTDAVAV